MILNLLHDFDWECFSDIYNAYFQDNNIYNLEYKYIYFDEIKKNINYIENFELIDINIFNKINYKEEIKNKISIPISDYYFFDNKILILYEHQQKKDIFIINYIQDNNKFISEYYVESLEYINQPLRYHFSKNKLSNTLKGNNNEIKNSKNEAIGKIYKIYKIDNNSELNANMPLDRDEQNKQLNVSSSKVIEGKLYLINEKWFSEYKKFYLFEEIKNLLIKTDNISSIERKILIENIYGQIKDKLINNYQKNNNEFLPLLNNTQYLNFEFGMNNDQMKINLSNQYSFINDKILSKIITPNINKSNIRLSEYYINNKKFIVNCGTTYIAIGVVSLNTYSTKFNPEIVLEYNNSELNAQFIKFKNIISDIKSFLGLNGNTTIENLFEKNSNRILGKAFFLNQVAQNIIIIIIIIKIILLNY